MDSVTSQSTIPFNVDLKIFTVECQSTEVLVKFQGKFSSEFEFDYHILQNEIQNVPKVKDHIGIGQFCLVEDEDSMEWHRGRILNYKGDISEVLLIDTGNIVKVSANQVASACGELFQLPPKIVCGIFSNILPIDVKWTPKAVNYFSSLIGINIKGNVQKSLPSQVVVLEVQKVINDVIELRLAKYVDCDTFNLIVEMVEKFPLEPFYKQMPDLLQQKPTLKESLQTLSNFVQVVDHLRPLLSVGTAEKVKITAAESPNKFYCQMLPWVQELEKLTSAITLHYEAISEDTCDHFGLLCAAKRQDGQWYRGVLRQLLSNDKVKVWFMDFGYNEDVPSQFIHKLQTDFCLLPMMCVPCGLSCLTKNDEKDINAQLELLRKALLGETVLVYLNLFNMEQRLYQVTLHPEDLPVPDTMKHENRLIPLFSPSGHTKTITKDDETEICDRPSTPFQNVVSLESRTSETNKNSFCTKISCPMMQMEIDSVYVVYVQYVLNPSNFWVRNSEHEAEYLTIMKNIEEKYATPEAFEKPIENPVPGLLCCARYSKDSHFYRAVVSEVEDSELIVYFLDFGNTETVPYCDVKPLFPEFCELPAIAMCCALGNAVSLDEIWTKKESDFFKKIVLANPLLLHVLGKQNEKYFVDLRHTDTDGESNVVTLMVQAGCAEYWKPIQPCTPSQTKDSKVSELKDKNKPKQKDKNKPKQSAFMQTSQMIASNCSKIEGVKKNLNGLQEALHCIPSSKMIPSKQIVTLGAVGPLSHYDQHIFKPGTIVEAICSHMCSPSDFWCQLNSKYTALETLMKRMQNHYEVNEEPYLTGQVTCVARRLVDGKWYRGAIVDFVSKEEVVVMFVDFGYLERIKVVDLKGINPDFLKLKGQAFRCSLYNLVEPINADPINWTTNACADFRSFLDSATFGSLKCTIYALILFTPTHLCNVVNLETPFLTAKQFLIDKGHAQTFELTKPLMPPISMFSFMYSSHNVKIGSEEEICITHIYNAKKFYCQLSKNSDTIDALMTRVAQIADRMIPSEDCQLHLCIAKYFEDGNFYRARVCPTRSSSFVMVYFVDFGNKQVVEKHELLPIPREATDLLYTPMQASRCYLSDLTAHVIPPEVDKWFEENYLGKILKAVVVSKDMDGQLSVELYDGDVKINKKIKELVKKHAKVCGDELEKNTKLVSNVKHIKVEANNSMDCVKKISRINSTTLANDLSSCTQVKEAFDNKQEIKVPVYHSVTHDKFEFSSRSNSEISCDTSTNLDSDGYSLNLVPGAEKVATKRTHYVSQQNILSNVSPIYTNLPKPNLKPSTELLGYVSHISGPSSFCIQLADDEHAIIQLAEELNSQCANLLSFSKEHEFQIGDLVVAEYTNDAAFYRAVIKQVNSVELFGVEFIDYGNESVVRRSSLYQLPVKYQITPRLSIPALLSGSQISNSEIDLSFLENLCNTGETVNFKFVQEHELHWEVKVCCESSIGVESLTCHRYSGQQKRLGNQLHVGRLDLNQNAIVEEAGELITATVCPTEKFIFDKANQPERRETVAHPIPNPSVASGQLEKAKLHSISACGTFYVTLKESTVESVNVSVLVDSAAQLEVNLMPAESIKVGIMCLAKSERIKKWLRSEVKGVFHEEKKMLVFFVDLGKTEKVSMSNAKVLNENLKCIPRQSVACKWAWLEKAGKQTFLSVMSSLTHQVLKILFLRYMEYDCTWEVEILVGDLLLMQYLGSSSCPVKKTEADSNSTVTLVPVCSVPWIKLQNLKLYPGFASVITDPYNFFVQLEESFECMMDLFLLLSDLPDNVPRLPPEQVIPGSHCLLKYEVIDKWCRAEVCKVSMDIVALTLIDLGICLQIPASDIEKLKIIPEQIVCLPRLVYQCTLSEVMPSNLEKWTEQAIIYFKDYLHEKEILIKFRNFQKGSKLEVDILNEHCNLADDLVAAGHAVRQVRKKSSFNMPICTESVDSLTKPFKMTWTKKSAKLDVVGENNGTNLPRNFRDPLPYENKTAECENSFISTHLSAAQLRGESSTYNQRENGKSVHFPQPSNKEFVEGSNQVFTFQGLSKADAPSSRKYKTPKTSGNRRLKEQSKCK